MNETEGYNRAFMALEKDNDCSMQAVGAKRSDASKERQTRGINTMISYTQILGNDDIIQHNLDITSL
jgi:hypothetical protein